jgi:hypothetical protein
MEVYHNNKPTVSTTPAPETSETAEQGDEDEYDAHRKQLLRKSIQDEGWRSELHRYLDVIPADVGKDTDIIEWWGVCDTVIFVLWDPHGI